MSNKEIFHKAYKDIEPSEALVERTLRQTARSERRIHFKCTAVIAVSLAAAACFTVTAAASGLIDFEALFGRRYKAESKELAEKIMAGSENVRNFSYKVSSDDYCIELKSVAGDAKNVMVSTVLKRKDGEPLFRHYDDKTWIGSGKPVHSKYAVNPFEELDCQYSHYHGAFINSDGNIEMNTDYMSESVLSGKKIWAEGFDFYFTDIDDEMMSVNVDGIYEPVPVQTNSGIHNIYLALDIEWQFEFDYVYSGELTDSKGCGAREEKFSYYETLCDETSRGVWEDIGEYDNSATLIRVDISAANGYFVFEFPEPRTQQFEMTNNAYCYISDRNEIYLIKSDGTHIPAVIDFGHISWSDNTFRGTYNFYYGEKADVIEHGGARGYFPEAAVAPVKEVIDPDEISAISINGTVYTLT